MNEVLSFIATWFVGIVGVGVFVGGFILACKHDAECARQRKAQLDALQAAANPIRGLRQAS